MSADAFLIEQLRERVELQEMQLVACMTACSQNTRSTMAQRIGPDNPYYSVAYSDVCRAVDREVKEREMARRLAFALRDAVKIFQPGKEITVTAERVEAWIAVLKEHDAGY